MTDYDFIKQAYFRAVNHENGEVLRLKGEAEKFRCSALRYMGIAARKMGDYNRLCWKSNDVRKTYWTNGLVKPLMEVVSRKTGLNFDTSDLRTYGIGCECPVSAVDENGEWLAWVTFVPAFGNDKEECPLYMYSGEMVDRYEEGTIGEINGGNNVKEPVIDVETVIENLRRNFPNLKLKCDESNTD